MDCWVRICSALISICIPAAALAVLWEKLDPNLAGAFRQGDDSNPTSEETRSTETLLRTRASAGRAARPALKL
ncbi:hypothetical protein R3P38DRAFT_2878910 [Favolaschia claudopus]|uniref:Uncharacterized protein n=1 Tax=Favolaschia claudopus TaxID=2862362 RepID=A0AAW0CW96_9AGAR